MIILWLLAFIKDNLLLYIPAYFLVSFAGIYYLWKIHPRLFHPKPTWVKSSLLSIVAFGFGQIYNRQLIQGLLFNAGLILIPFSLKAMDYARDDIILIFFSLFALSAVIAGISAKSAGLRMLIIERKKEVKKKADQLVKYRDQGYDFGLDTNFLMHEPDLLLELLDELNLNVYISMQVLNELDGLKKNDNPHTRRQAQIAFDIIEAYQKQNKISLLKVPNYRALKEVGFQDSPDEKIIGSYNKKVSGISNLLFLSNDKGARIIARNAGMPVAEID